jgi:hypothetical protein
MLKKREANGGLQLPDNMNGSNLRMKNTLIQRQFDLYVTTIDRQVRYIVEGRDQRYRATLTDKVKKINNFKKFQYDTELELQENRLKEFITELNEEVNAKLAGNKLSNKASLKSLNSNASSRTNLNSNLSMKKSTPLAVASTKSISKSSIETKSQQRISSVLKPAVHTKSFDLSTIKAVQAARIDNEKVFNQVKSDIKVELISRFSLENDHDLQAELNKKPLETESTEVEAPDRSGRKSVENSDNEMSDLSEEEDDDETEAIYHAMKKPDAKNSKDKVFQETVNIIKDKVRNFLSFPSNFLCFHLYTHLKI